MMQRFPIVPPCIATVVVVFVVDARRLSRTTSDPKVASADHIPESPIVAVCKPTMNERDDEPNPVESAVSCVNVVSAEVKYSDISNWLI